MKLDEVRQLFNEMRIHCSRDFPADPYRQEESVKSWHKYLAPFEYEDAIKALETYIMTDNRGYMPTVSLLLSMMPSARQQDFPTPGEMWAIVLDKLKDSTYTPKESFDSLPDIARRIIGSADSFRELTGKDKEMFMQQYKEQIEKEQGGFSWEDRPIEAAEFPRSRELKRALEYFEDSIEVSSPRAMNIIQFVQYEGYPSGIIKEARAKRGKLTFRSGKKRG